MTDERVVWNPEIQAEKDGERLRQHMDIERRRKEYEQHEADRRELQRITAERDELAAYLRRRGEAYVDAAGEGPSEETLEQWTVEYTNRKEADRQAKRERLISDQQIF
jgi:hypothetical protein